MKRGLTTEEVYQQLRNSIIQGDLLPGEKLATERLARQYEVSRTPVREALKKLERDGLVKSEANTGAVIRKIELEEALDIYEIREALEAMAVRKAIENLSGNTLPAFLRKLCDQRRRAKNLDELERNDIEFHMAICKASKSTILLEMIENHIITLASFSGGRLYSRKRDLSRDEEGNKEHEGIVDAIERRDIKSAVELMKAHISSARAVVKRMAQSLAKGG